MKREIVKPAKIALCRRCRGKGEVADRYTGIGNTICPQCQGSGRVVVACEMKINIEPYKP